jgi:hypothetical protein
MPSQNIRVLSFDTGIDHIIQGDDVVPEKLPDTTGLLPSEEHLRLHLDEMLHPLSLEEQVLNRLTPNISNKGILIPARFHSLIEETYHELKQQAEMPGPLNKKEALISAARVLEEEKELMDLLNSNRKILLKA